MMLKKLFRLFAPCAFPPGLTTIFLTYQPCTSPTNQNRPIAKRVRLILIIDEGANSSHPMKKLLEGCYPITISSSCLLLLQGSGVTLTSSVKLHQRIARSTYAFDDHFHPRSHLTQKPVALLIDVGRLRPPPSVEIRNLILLSSYYQL